MAKDLNLKVTLGAVDKATGTLKNIGRGAGSLGEQLKKTRENLKGLQAQQKDISSFREVKDSLVQNGAAMVANRDRLQALSREMASTATPSKALTREFQSATRQGEALKQKHNEQLRTLQGLHGKLGQAGISTRNLATHEADLKRKISQTTDTMGKQEQQLKRLADKQRALAKARASYDKSRELQGNIASGGAKAAAVGGAALYVGAQMMAPQVAAQQQGSLIAAQSGEGSARAGQYTSIIQGIRADGLSSDMASIGAAVAAVNSTLGALGKVSDTEIDRASRKALDMAAVLGGDVAEHIQTASILMKNGLAGSSDEAFDLITRGMQQVSTKMRGELPEILHEYSTHFRGLGFDGKEAMSLLVDMAEQGKFALDKTGDALKEFSIRGSDMSKASVAAYEQVGLNAAQMSSAIAGGGDGARKALQQTAKGLLSISDPAGRANAAIALFGTPVEDLAIDQIPAFLKALSSGTDNMGEVQGAASQLGDTLRDNLGGDIGRLSGAWGALQGALLNGQGGGLREVTQQLTGIINGVKGWIAENPKLAGNIVKVGAGVAALAVGVGSLALAVAGILGPIAMAKFALVTLGVTTGIALKPLLLVVGAAALLAGAAYLIYRNWEPIKTFFLGMWNEIKLGFSGGFAGIAATIVNFSPLGLLYRAFAAALGYLGVDLPGRFTEFGGMLMQGLVNGIKNMAGAVKNAVVGAADSSIGWFKEKLGIRSPSRVFAALGGDTMAGLAQGLAGGEGGAVKQLLGTAKRLTAAGAIGLTVAGGTPAFADMPQIDSRPPLAAAAAGGSGSSSVTYHYEVHIHAGAGLDEQAIARAVGREIEKIKRTDQARSRSSMLDLD